MSRYDGLIIPRSYSEYINKTDSATLQQALQLSGVFSGVVAAGDNKAVKSSAVYEALTNYINKTDADTLSQALALPGVMDAAPTESSNKAARSGGIYNAIDAVKPVDTVALNNMKAATSNAVYNAIKNKQTINPATNINLPELNDEINFYKLSLNDVSIDGIKSDLINYGFQNIRTGTSFIVLVGPGGQRFTVILSHSGRGYFGGIIITFYLPITYIKYSNGTWS